MRAAAILFWFFCLDVVCPLNCDFFVSAPTTCCVLSWFFTFFLESTFFCCLPTTVPSIARRFRPIREPCRREIQRDGSPRRLHYHHYNERVRMHHLSPHHTVAFGVTDHGGSRLGSAFPVHDFWWDKNHIHPLVPTICRIKITNANAFFQALEAISLCLVPLLVDVLAQVVSAGFYWGIALLMNVLMCDTQVARWCCFRLHFLDHTFKPSWNIHLSLNLQIKDPYLLCWTGYCLFSPCVNYWSVTLPNRKGD